MIKLTQLCIRKRKNSYAVFPLGRLPCPVYTLICALAQLLFLESVPHMQSAPPTHLSPNNSGIIQRFQCMGLLEKSNLDVLTEGDEKQQSSVF